ncbi:25S rRNA (adenine2142-N1)-methyltransferase [Yamadazyma tenuis]|uniref:25S rRNA adenine-N(1) methyltransferase n=1 Tax=Candida tenuis (strain ATCC 10573 / BCRC 21748 / CBS 615 / JCM 9827 / NBRC 10315 / NRRL Y-1498 / VKM Y-70) TaxID=590646 RepID=G3B4W2_CANTC|nr:uncharacterized protein CANTEDRAFT_130354 [Yamadazyma tenuis ATCC 10573]EGV64001.1 hypothetical protein CANTEDRAFT_130354 [Yamadazyma tenuis ATCC 10573]WEJ96379.1 25S rRNA (adenine2142-N1)-methyltransferase [Yamadazyma tenuis]
MGLLKRNRSITQKQFAPKSLKPQHTRKLIRRFHVLLKNKAIILQKLAWDDNYESVLKGNHKQVYDNGTKTVHSEMFKLEHMNKSELVRTLGQIDGEIHKSGGLEVYQIASQQGQSNKRGSDSSKKLVEWLKSAYELQPHWKALEIGCLSPDNLISTSKLFESVVRIDLNSQHHLILQQDFMERPLPANHGEKFNLVSCSLVLNFVPTPKERGDMLRRITKFLVDPGENILSALFLVIPLPCVSNSRYLDYHKVKEIMEVLGLKERFYHESNKLAYWLFDWSGKTSATSVKKIELHRGGSRNNFAVVL